MSLFDFCDSGIRSWFSEGMIKSSTADAEIKKNPEKKKKTIPSIGSIVTNSLAVVILVTSSISTSAQTISIPDSSAFVYTYIPAPGEREKNGLLEALKSIESLGENWHDYDVPMPSKKAVTAARQIVPFLPNITANVSAGVDGDGNVYLKLQQGEKLAYLTVEPSIMHLLVMVPGGTNIYIDDAKFQPRELPSKIRQALEHEMVA